MIRGLNLEPQVGIEPTTARSTNNPRVRVSGSIRNVNARNRHVNGDEDPKTRARNRNESATRDPRADSLGAGQLNPRSGESEGA